MQTVCEWTLSWRIRWPKSWEKTLLFCSTVHLAVFFLAQGKLVHIVNLFCPHSKFAQIQFCWHHHHKSRWTEHKTAVRKFGPKATLVKQLLVNRLAQRYSCNILEKKRQCSLFIKMFSDVWFWEKSKNIISVTKCNLSPRGSTSGQQYSIWDTSLAASRTSIQKSQQFSHSIIHYYTFLATEYQYFLQVQSLRSLDVITCL